LLLWCEAASRYAMLGFTCTIKMIKNNIYKLAVDPF
jgi:hypothetical protein